MNEVWDPDCVYSMLRHIDKNVDYDYFLDRSALDDWYERWDCSPLPHKEHAKMVAYAPNMYRLLKRLRVEALSSGGLKSILAVLGKIDND